MEDSSTDWEEADSNISPEEGNEIDEETYKFIDKSMKSIWKTMRKMESDLNKLTKTDGELSFSDDRKNMDDEDFILSFPLTEMDDVLELESRLKNGSSEFKEDFIKYITPECQNSCDCLSDIKYFMGLVLRRLFTNKFASIYSWRGFQGNFKIGKLRVSRIIFDITRSKYTNVTKKQVNLLIKEWIKYAKQRHKLRRRIKKGKRAKKSSV